MEICTKDSSKMISLTVMENITGKIKVILRDIFLMDFAQDKVYGKKVLETAINMRDNIKMIKSGDMEYLHGQMETSLKETTKGI